MQRPVTDVTYVASVRLKFAVGAAIAQRTSRNHAPCFSVVQEAEDGAPRTHSAAAHDAAHDESHDDGPDESHDDASDATNGANGWHGWYGSSCPRAAGSK